jgi:MFS family permease
LKTTFWNRDFAFALMGYFFLFLSVTLFYLFPLFLEQFHPPKSWVGLSMGIHSVTAIMIRPFFGRIVDERGGRKMALLGILIMIAVIPGFHLIKSAGILVLILRALSGGGWGIAMTATMAMCSDLAPVDRLAHSLGIIGIGGIVAGAAGPMLAEEIARHYGFGGIFDASLIFLAAALICMIVTRELPRQENNDATATESRLGGFSIWIFIIISTMPVIHGAVRGAVVNFIALYGTSIGFSRVGPFFLAFSAAAILTRVGIGDISDRYGRKQVIFPAALLISLNLFWIAAVQGYEIFILNGFIAGLGQGLIFPALSTYIIDGLGHQKKGFALGLYLSLFDVGMGLGSPFFGWISDMAGYRRMYMVAGALLLSSTIMFSLKAPSTKASPPCRNPA